MDLRSSLLLEDSIPVITVHDHVGTEQRGALAGRAGCRARPGRRKRGRRVGTAAPVPAAWGCRPCHGCRVAACRARYLIRANQPALPVYTDAEDALRAVRVLLSRPGPALGDVAVGGPVPAL